MNKTIFKTHRFQGKPSIPGDKSISHRGLIFGALASGRSEIVDILDGGDVESTARCLQQLGVQITRSGNRTYIDGIGMEEFSSPNGVLDCGNSGTTLRLLMGALAGRKVTAILSGDASLVGRPMKRVADPLRQMGASLSLAQENFPPLTIRGGKLCGIDYELKIASAQIKSAILLAALSAEGVTRLTGAIYSRDHTEKLLRHFGAELEASTTQIQIPGKQRLQASTIRVPGDPSSAAYWIGAASVIPDAHIEMENVLLNPTRIGFIRALERMGASISVEVTSETPEQVGKIQGRPGVLRGIKISRQEVPSLIDELPLLAVLATQAEGVTEVEGAEELRVKECDRLGAVEKGLRSMGIEIEMHQGGFRLEGPQKLYGAPIETFHDHRIAMAFSIAGLLAEGETLIQNPDCVNISYPQFYRTLEELT